MTLYEEIDRCRMCGSFGIERILDLGAQRLSGVFTLHAEDVPVAPLVLCRCGDCGLVQLSVNVDPATLFGGTYGYRTGLNQSMVEHVMGVVAEIEERVQLGPNDLVLDIGANDGTLLNSYSAHVLRRFGVDPAATQLRRFNHSSLIVEPELFSAEVFRRAFGNGKAKVITSLAMFYDLPDPNRFVEDVLECLAPDGIWVTEQSYLPAMVAANSFDTICHEHLEYYTVADMAGIAVRYGLDIIDLSFSATNGGSFRVTLARRDAPYADVHDLTWDIMKDERLAGFKAGTSWERTVQPWKRMADAMDRCEDQLHSLLVKLKAGGKRVLGYGASTKGNVLLQWCGIGPDLIEAVVDVNPDKFGKQTATGIPIILELMGELIVPDYYLVLPWHFRESIVARERAFLQLGGSLIFPLPVLEIVNEGGSP